MDTLKIGQIVKSPGLGCWVECTIESFSPGGYVHVADKHGKVCCHASRLLVKNGNGNWCQGGIVPANN